MLPRRYEERLRAWHHLPWAMRSRAYATLERNTGDV